MHCQKIHILLATYNGGEFILPQLNSIFGQTHKNSFVTIRDDGSTDNTTEVLKNIIQNNNIEFFENIGFDKGHCCNFSALCKIGLQSDADYFCFSDQDDVWKRDKLELLMEQMHKLEKHNIPASLPTLIHSDLTVVDEKLNLINKSFIKYQGLPNPDKHHFPEFFYQNIVTGCTTMFNHALLEFATPIPPCVVVHDFWFALCAEYIGKIGFIDKSLVKYRQHDNNSIGAVSFENKKNYLNKHIYKSILKFPFHIAQCIEQVKALKQRCIDREINPLGDKRKYLELFISLRDKNLVTRLKSVSIIFRGKKCFLERIYLYAVVIILPLIEVSR